MTVALLVALGVAIGLLLGALGGGGAVLSVPALVFLVGQTANEATTSSLIIVGTAALTGVASHLRSGSVDWRTGLAFGLAGVPAAWAGSQLNQAVAESVLLTAFGVLMIVAAGVMLRGLRSPQERDDSAERVDAGHGHDGTPDAPEGASTPAGGGATGVLERPGTQTPRRDRRARVRSWLAVAGVGLVVGAVTGFFGVGGGFVVVPVLVMALGLPMARAIGTSLVVVAITSASALVSRIPVAEFEWDVIVPFASAAVVASLLGRRVTDRLPARQLQAAFVVLLVLVAGYTIARGLLG